MVYKSGHIYLFFPDVMPRPAGGKGGAVPIEPI